MLQRGCGADADTSEVANNAVEITLAARRRHIADAGDRCFA